MEKKAIYNKLPVWGQNLACYYYGIRIKRSRYGKDFWRLLAEYEKRANWSYEQLCDYRDARLRKMIRHCYNTVPYYRDLFQEGGINPDSIKTLEDLKALPVLTKQVVNEQPERFISTAYPKNKMVTAHTSGTTGSGFIFKTTAEAICEQWAVWWRYRRALGIEFDTMCGLFGGRSVVPTNNTKAPFYRVNYPCRQLYFSIYHMSDANLPFYVEAIRKHNIRWLHGYPSALHILASFLNAHNEKLAMDYVTVGAENLLEGQKEAIKKAYNVEPYEHYGLSEGVSNFSQKKHREIIVDEDLAATEFLPRDDGISFDIIGTNLTNYAMPLIRYATNDICVVKTTSEGRVITSLDGRKEDYVLLPNGARVGRLDHIFKDLTDIREAQIIQKNAWSVEIVVVRNKNYSHDSERRLLKEAQERMPGLSINIRYKDYLERSATGKLRFVVSEIK